MPFCDKCQNWYSDSILGNGRGLGEPYGCTCNPYAVQHGDSDYGDDPVTIHTHSPEIAAEKWTERYHRRTADYPSETEVLVTLEGWSWRFTVTLEAQPVYTAHLKTSVTPVQNVET